MRIFTSKFLLTLSALCIAFLEAFADPDLYTISVTNGNVFTISRTDASAASYVDYYTQSGSAIAGIHFESISGRLEFAKDETEKTLTVPALEVSTIDNYVLTTEKHTFFLCIYNNHMPAMMAEGSFNNTKLIPEPSEKNILLKEYFLGTDDYTTYITSPNLFDTLPDTDVDKAYFILSEQTPHYKFNLQLYMQLVYAGWYDISLYFLNENEKQIVYKTTGEIDDIPVLKVPGTNATEEEFTEGYSDLWQSSEGYILTNDGIQSVGLKADAHGSGDDYYRVYNLTLNYKFHDASAPVIKGIYVNTDHIYYSGEGVYLSVRFNEPVQSSVSNAVVRIDGKDYTFSYKGGNGTNTLYFYCDDITTTKMSGITGTVTLKSLDGTVRDVNGNQSTFADITSNNTCQNFKMNLIYTVSLQTNGGAIQGGKVDRYTYGVGATLPTVVEKDGYEFAGWYDNENFSGTQYTEITEDDYLNKTFYAKWIEKNVCNIQVEETIKNARCFGESNGEIALTITNAAEPYTTKCSNEVFTDDVLRNLKAGDYLIEITDAENCSFTKTYTVTEPNLPEVSIANVTATACNENSGAVIVNGDDNLTYRWNTGNETKYLLNVNAGDYSLVATDGNGCTNTVQVTVPLITPKQPEIALVTVCEQTGKNLVVWLKEETNLIDFYTIYRENDEANVYEKLTTIPYGELSVYEDNEADPNIRAWRYKISATDVCGAETELSEHHKTMHITKNAGFDGSSNNLIWDKYEGLDFSTFIVMCKYKENNNIVTDTLTTLPSNVTSYSDVKPKEHILSYFVGIKLPEVIDPKTQFMKAESGPFALAISNIAEVENTDIPDAVAEMSSNSNIFAIGKTIYVKNAEGAKATVYDVSGHKIAFAEGRDEYTFFIKNDGVYFVKIGDKTFKIIVE
ncbi:MAG: InlB B-repeat-containing protein [Bacteroidales bacterium]|nr:InlB B-repeat-containing protein [Bacteroidales bacterium]